MAHRKEMVLSAIYMLLLSDFSASRIWGLLSCGPKVYGQRELIHQLNITYLQETIDEVARQPCLGLLLCAEVLEHV
jgi:hypothetical protein